MKKPVLITLVLLWSCALAAADSSWLVENKNAAFFEGENWNYVVRPPSGFQMVQREAVADGYSFAFVPDSERYSDADILIGVNLFKIRGMSFETVVSQDTLALRKHYGPDTEIWPVDSVFTGTNNLTTTFYVNDPGRFIPNVMISYVDGGAEVLIYELVISPTALRKNAEDAVLDGLLNTKLMPRGELGQR